jgi:hypothetical protein
MSNRGKFIELPYVSQWNFENQSGGGRCGYASLAMVMKQENITTEIIANIPKSLYGSNPIGGDNGFASWLKKQGYTRERVNSWKEVKEQLDKNHPVLIAVNAGKYIQKAGEQEFPFPISFGENNHIVVVKGYELDADGTVTHVYLSDPLAVKKDGDGKYHASGSIGSSFKVSIDDFKDAATSTSNPDWYGAAFYEIGD